VLVTNLLESTLGSQSTHSHQRHRRCLEAPNSEPRRDIARTIFASSTDATLALAREQNLRTECHATRISPHAHPDRGLVERLMPLRAPARPSIASQQTSTCKRPIILTHYRRAADRGAEQQRRRRDRVRRTPTAAPTRLTWLHSCAGTCPADDRIRREPGFELAIASAATKRNLATKRC
jgi:hypothetical protein